MNFNKIAFLTAVLMSSPAFAQEGATSASMLGQFLPLLLIFVFFWLLLIRPQQKKIKEHRALIAALRRGDKIVTSGGIIGTITKIIDDNEIMLEIAPKVEVRLMRATISSVLSKSEPVANAAKSKGKRS